MSPIINILIGAVAFYIGGRLLPGVHVRNFIQSIFVAIAVAILDWTLGNVLRIISLGLLSFGIFIWLLNALLIQIADYFLPGFKVKNFWWAVALAAVVSITTAIMSSILT